MSIEKRIRVRNKSSDIHVQSIDPKNIPDKMTEKEIEALKLKDINNINNNDLISINRDDTLVKFRQFY